MHEKNRSLQRVLVCAVLARWHLAMASMSLFPNMVEGCNQRSHLPIEGSRFRWQMPIPETHFFSHLTPCTRRVQSQLPPALRTTDPERQRLATTRCPTDQMRISLSNCCGGNRLKVPTFSGSELFAPPLGPLPYPENDL